MPAILIRCIEMGQVLCNAKLAGLLSQIPEMADTLIYLGNQIPTLIAKNATGWAPRFYFYSQSLCRGLGAGGPALHGIALKYS
jgi:hypothetical protein